MAIRRAQVLVFPRSRYRGDGAPSMYYPRERQKLGRLMGGANKVTFHGRLYDRSGAAVTVDFLVPNGAFSDEMPGEGPRVFGLTQQGQTPSLPWDNTHMANLPDDGTFYVQPVHGNVDVQLKIGGGANTWAEFEMWATLEYSG